jgi:branched-chain amino acid transport system permease protein
MRKRRTYIALALFGVAMIVAPLIVRQPYHQSVLVFIGINALAAIGLNLLMGYAGQVSLGHAAFLGIGAYSSAVLTVNHGVNPWLAMGAGVILTCLVAWVIGWPTLRLRGHYLAIATLGFGMIMNIVFIEWRRLTGGQSGIPGVPPLAIGDFVLDTHTRFYYPVWGLVFLATVASANLMRSRSGRALRAISSSELAAETAGINTGKYKLQIFVISAGLASLAGSLFVHNLSFANPEPFNFAYSIELVVMAVLGGLGNIWGPLVGAGVITVLGEVLPPLGRLLNQAINPAATAMPLELDVPAFGLILVLVLIFLPRGMTTSLAALGQRRRRSEAEAS